MRRGRLKSVGNNRPNIETFDLVLWRKILMDRWYKTDNSLLRHDSLHSINSSVNSYQHWVIQLCVGDRTMYESGRRGQIRITSIYHICDNSTYIWDNFPCKRTHLPNPMDKVFFTRPNLAARMNPKSSFASFFLGGIFNFYWIFKVTLHDR